MNPPSHNPVALQPDMADRPCAARAQVPAHGLGLQSACTHVALLWHMLATGGDRSPWAVFLVRPDDLVRGMPSTVRRHARSTSREVDIVGLPEGGCRD